MFDRSGYESGVFGLVAAVPSFVPEAADFDSTLSSCSVVEAERLCCKFNGVVHPFNAIAPGSAVAVARGDVLSEVELLHKFTKANCRDRDACNITQVPMAWGKEVGESSS